MDAMTDLGNLLAVIHGDGGQYLEEHGQAKACADAEALVSTDRADLRACALALRDVARCLTRRQVDALVSAALARPGVVAAMEKP